MVLSHSMLLTASMQASRRIFWSAIIQCVLLVLLALLIVYKVFNLPSDEWKDYPGPGEYHVATYFYYNLGFALEDGEVKAD